MSDAIVVTLDSPKTKVKPGQETLVGITVHNNSEDVETYELALEGPAQALGWAELQPKERTIAAFPMQDAQAKIVLRPPTGAPGATYILGVRATSRSTAGAQTVATLEISVDVPPPPPQLVVDDKPAEKPIDSPGIDSSRQQASVSPRDERRDGTIEITADSAPDPSLPRTTGEWRLRLRNGGLTTQTFGFSALEISPRMVSVEPPEVTLRPAETATALLSIRLSDETPEGNVRFGLRAYAYNDPRQRQDIPLAFLVRAPSGSSRGATTASTGATGPLNVVVDQDLFAVEPGITRRVNLAIQNRSSQALALQVQASGVPPDWFSLGVPSIRVQAQQIAQLEVAITSPNDALGGSYPLSIRGQASEGTGESFRVDLVVQVNAAGTQRPIRLSVESQLWRTAPGAVVEGKVQVQNLTQALANVGLNLQGIDPSWVQVVPTEQMVFQLGQAAIVVKVRPPNDLTQSLAGTYPVVIQGRSSQISDVGELKTELEIQLVGEYQVILGETEMSMVRQGSYPLLVRNQTNAPVQLELSATDPDGALLYLFDPPDVVTPPGGEAEVTLTIRARELVKQARPIDFTVVATGEYALHGGRHRDAGRREVVGRFAQLAAPAVNLAISPPSLEGADRGEYLVRLSNPAATAMTVSLTAADSNGALDYDVSPSEVTLSPREERVTKLLVQTKQQTKAGQQQDHAFTVTATPAEEDDALPASAEARLRTLRRHWWEPIVGILQSIRMGLARTFGFFGRHLKYLLLALALLLLLALLLFLRPVVAAMLQPAPIPSPTAAPTVASVVLPTPVPRPTASPTTETVVTVAPAVPPTDSTNGALEKQVTTLFQALPTPASATFIDPNGTTRVDLNSTLEVPAASTAKLPVMIAVWQQLNDGKLKPTDSFTVTKDKVVGGTGILQNQVGRTLTTEQLLEVTLLNSDNTGANMLIDRIGGLDQVNATLTTLGFTHTHIRRHFLDNVALQKGLDNTMSTGDMALMLEKIYRGQLISKAASDDMHRILLLRGQKTDSDLDYMGRKLVPRPPLAHVNGVLTGIRNDGGIVEPPSGPFIVAIFLSNQANEAAAEDAIATTTAGIFNAMTQAR
jgi:beta-lactamase class A